MARIRPLSTGQQKFLQLLMARHVLSDSEAKSLYASLSADAENNGAMGRSLENCLGIINSSLGPAFGLEIRTVSLDKRCSGGNPTGNDTDQSQSQSQSSSSAAAAASNNNSMVRYHALVNKIADEPSKSTFMTATTASNPHHGPSVRSPHEMAYLRLILEKIVERGLDAEEDGDGANVGAGCVGSLGRISVLNLCKELDGPHKDKITLAQAESSVGAMIAEDWLVPSYPPAHGDDDDDDDDEDEDDGEDNGGKRKRGGGRKKSKGGRTSLDGLGGDGPALSHLMVGPRTYMELPDLLKDLGLEKVPQFILHSSR